MRKVIKNLVTTALAVLMIFSSVACSSNSNGKELSVYSTQDGLHQIYVAETGANMIASGVSDYKIVIPEGASLTVENAAKEIQEMLSLSAGVKLPIITDRDIVYYPNQSTFISVGETKLVAFADVEVDKKTLQDSGFIVKTVDKSVFLVGGGDRGTYFAVSEFLKHTIDYAVYTDNEKIYSKKANVKLFDFDVTEVPDFAYRMPYTRRLFQNTEFSANLRLNHEDDSIISVNGLKWHNSFAYLPKSIHGEAHPDWYATTGDQLCYLARGNEEEFEHMVDAFMEKFIDTVIANPEIENITITMEDYATWCGCSACIAETQKYGGAGSVTVLKFCNIVSDRFEEYKKEHNLDRNVNIWFFAYLTVEDAPVKKNDKGEYVAIDETAVCRDNVFPFYAALYAKYNVSFYDQVNAGFKDKLDQWKAISKKICIWSYAVNFSDFLGPYDFIGAMKETYVFFKNYNVHFLFEQSQHLNNPAPDWSSLKIWLSSKLMWNVNYDINQLIDEFFTNYYKQASEPMKELLYYFMANLDVIRNTGGDGGVFTSNMSKKYYPRGTVVKFIELVDKAFESIEGLKETDSKTYDMLYDRIALDSLTFRYIDIQLYGDTYGEKDLLAKKLAFKEDATRVGILKTSEKYQNEGFIDELWKQWGI